MKIKKLILVLSVGLLLTSCGNETSVRRDDRDTSSNNSVTTIQDGDIYSSIVSGITTAELQTIIDASKKALPSIRSLSTVYSSISYKYDENFSNQTIDEAHTLTSKTLRYNNSVLYTNNSASDFDDYEEFGFVSEEDEKKLSSFTYLNFEDEKEHLIETRTVYQKDGETTTTVKIENSLAYSVDNYDKTFLLVSESALKDISDNENKEHAEIIGILNNGQVFARFTYSENSTDENEQTIINTTKLDYYYKNSNLVNINVYISSYLEDEESLLYPTQTITMATSFSYIENGNYDKSQMPSVSVTDKNNSK